MIVIFISIFVHSATAIREMPQSSFDVKSYLSLPTTTVSVFEKAREITMASWLARLPAGPSPRGAGH